MSADEKKKAIGTIIKLIEEVSEKELEKLKELKNSSIDDIAKAHTDAFGRIFEEFDSNMYKNNYPSLLSNMNDEKVDFDEKVIAFNRILESFKDVKIKENLKEEEKKNVLDLFEAILDFYKDDEKKVNEFKNLEKQVEKIEKELKDGTKDKSKVIFDGDRCYQVTDGDDGSVNVRFKGLCYKKEEEVVGGRKRKSRKRRRKSKRKLRRKNRKSRKSKRKNRKSRRKSIKR